MPRSSLTFLPRLIFSSLSKFIKPPYLLHTYLLHSTSDKFITFILLVVAEMLIHGLWYVGILAICRWGWYWDVSWHLGLALEDIAVVNQQSVEWMAWACLAMMVFSLLSVAVMRRLAIRSCTWHGYQTLYIVAYLCYGLLFALHIGQNTAVSGIGILSGMVLGLLLIPWQFVSVAFILSMLTFIFVMLNHEYQWIRELPSFFVPHHASKSLLWSVSFIYLAVTKASLTIFMVSQVLMVLHFQQKLIRQNAETDPLTGAFNRRNMHYYFNYLWQYANSWHCLSVVYLDIDHFKCINDKYGHDTGDQALALVVAAIRQVIDGKFYLCRHGGEEFLLIMPNTSLADATHIAEDIRQALRLCEFGSIKASDQPLTASFGVAGLLQAPNAAYSVHPYMVFEEFVESFEAQNLLPPLPTVIQVLLNVVDQAMQTAKQQGRDRVVTVPAMVLDKQLNLSP